MNIKSINTPDQPNWMQRFRPTDIKWLNEEKTAALCVLSDQRYHLKLIWTKDGTPQGTNCEEIASTQDIELEKLEQAFDSFEPSQEMEAENLVTIASQIRQQIAA
ncbi:hypothetical protein JW752_02465 [Candidatus Peregrinibacteria bacterium]|nr:hypothetical protein [Candidatus Peregrinibacteria bacterium]